MEVGGFAARTEDSEDGGDLVEAVNRRIEELEKQASETS